MSRTLKTVISTVLCYLMIITMMPFTSFKAEAAYTGAGTATSPYLVSTGADLISVIENYNVEGVCVKLTKDISLDSTFVPGTLNINLDGDFHKITAQTLFSVVNNGTLKNFYFENTVKREQISGSGSNFSLIANQNNGTISGVIARGDIESECTHNVSDTSGSSYVSDGALFVGYNYGTIVNCAAIGSVAGYCPYGSTVAGITRYTSGGTVSNCYVAATISATGSSRYGSSSHCPISFSSYENCFYNSELYSSDVAGGFTTAEMKKQSFVDLLNVNNKAKDSMWTVDTANKNDGYPVLKKAYNMSITSSKTDFFISSTEYITLTCEDPNAKIYYSTNGSTPTSGSTLYTGSIRITDDVTIAAVPYYNGMTGAPVYFNYSKIEGSGTKASPYIIRSYSDFTNIPALSAVNENYRASSYKLAANIKTLEPMFSFGTFSGDFNGAGYTVSNVYNTSKSSFAEVNNGTIRNLHFKSRDNSTVYTDGFLAKTNNGLIYNCSFTGSVEAGASTNSDSLAVGGFCGTNNGAIDRCFFKGNTDVIGSRYAGGFAGINKGTICNSYFEGASVRVRDICFHPGSQGYVGGFLGQNASDADVYNCYCIVDSVYVTTGSYVGSYAAGFACMSGGRIENVYASCGSVSVPHHYLEWGINDTAKTIYCLSGVTDKITTDTLDYQYYNSGSKPTLKIFSDAHMHNYVFSKDEPTCIATGSDYFTCSGCGYKISGRRYDKVYCECESEFTIDTPATCETDGSKSYHCKVCSARYTVTTIPALGHSFKNYVSDNNATYYENGTKTAKCERCDKTNTVTEYNTKIAPVSIEIITSPDKTNYVVGQSLKTEGLTFLARYADGGEATFTNTAVSLSRSFTVAGKEEITVTYMGCSDSFDVYVHEEERTKISSSLYPESSHNYANNSNETKTFVYEGAEKLELTFSSSTNFENGYDYLYIYYGENDSYYGRYTYNTLAGKSITINSDRVKLVIKSNSSVTKYGYSFTSIVAIGMDHDVVIIPATYTCTTDGMSEGRYCNFCGEELVSIEPVAAPGHSYVDHEVKAPTCTEIGWNAYQTCENCDYTTYEELPATEHINKYIEGKTEPNCVTPGYKVGLYCPDCDTWLMGHEEIPATGHTYVDHEAKAPTCTEIGWNAYQTCENCDYTTYSELPATGHAYVDHEAKAPDCTQIGWNAYQTCENCDYTTYSELPATGHAYVDHEAKAPTCMDFGWNAYQTCEKCDYTTYAELPATGHTNVDYEAKAPTCTEIGWNAYQACENCDYTTYSELPATGHIIVNHEAKKPTCISVGWEAYETCENCDYTTYKELTDIIHLNKILTDRSEPTCVSVGYTEGLLCVDCGTWIMGHEEISAAGHSYVDHEARVPDCTQIGWNSYQTCENCDYMTYSELPATGHTEVVDEAVNPTCTGLGFTQGTHCHDCGEVFVEREEIPALGHSWDKGSIDVKETCTDEGVMIYTCSACNEEKKEVITAKGHMEITVESVPPTCTLTGLTNGTKCSVCDAIIVAQDIIPATGHTYDSVITAPTCTEGGYTTNTCGCGYSYVSDKVDPLDHNEIKHEAKDPTCTEKGYEEYVTCSRCDYTTYKEIAATGHCHILVETAPTCTEEGYTTYTCACGDTYTETIAKLGHSYSESYTVDLEPICTAEGSKSKHCTRSGCTAKTSVTAIAKLDHTYDNACDKECNVCKTVRNTSHSYESTTTKATLTKNGKIVNKCSVCGYAKTTTIYYPRTFTLSTTAYTYNGKTKTPTVTVKDYNGNTLKKDTDYTVSYESGRKVPGKYTVTITFKGKYTGTKKLYFTIAPKATSKITASQTITTITLKWSKVTGADGYRVYKYNSKTKKYEYYKSTTSTSLKISKLKEGTAYKYKVRAYTKDDGTIYGEYSKVFETATKCKTPSITKLTTTKGKASYTWSNVSGESGYQVYYSTKKDSGYKKVASYKANTTKGSKSKLTSGKTYYFKVRAYKKTASGTVYSAWSSVKSIKIK
ncbi:MAG: bacterial Ig-like domain-containing protein [Acutalibacteraceae bacterium]|nr:bacterial Ig-like domain-containing protein [Acutalibacteraceae bacterium]